MSIGHFILIAECAAIGMSVAIIVHALFPY